MGVIYKRMLLTAFVNNRDFTQTEISELRNLACKKSLDNCTMVFRESNKLGEGLQIFDFYTIESLNFYKRLLHHLGIAKAAVLGYFGINTVAIVVK